MFSTKKGSSKSVITMIGSWFVLIFGILACVLGTVQAILDQTPVSHDKYWCVPEYNSTSFEMSTFLKLYLNV